MQYTTYTKGTFSSTHPLLRPMSKSSVPDVATPWPRRYWVRSPHRHHSPRIPAQTWKSDWGSRGGRWTKRRRTHDREGCRFNSWALNSYKINRTEIMQAGSCKILSFQYWLMTQLIKNSFAEFYHRMLNKSAWYWHLKWSSKLIDAIP